MNNQQLCLLLEGIIREVNTAIEQSRDLLSAERPSRIENQRYHIDGTACVFFGLCRNPEHYSERDVATADPVVELEPLDKLLVSLESRIEILKDKPG